MGGVAVVVVVARVLLTVVFGGVVSVVGAIVLTVVGFVNVGDAMSFGSVLNIKWFYHKYKCRQTRLK